MRHALLILLLLASSPRRGWRRVLGPGLLTLAVSACALFEPQSRVRAGNLFTTGQPAYDDYFSKVHALQVEVTGFGDDKKAARRGVIDALKLPTDSVDVTVLQATHERMVAIAHTVGNTHLDVKEDEAHITLQSEGRADLPTRDFVKSLQAMIDGEMKRKHALRDVPQKCDDLAKIGHDLEPRVHDDFFRQGGTMMADVHDELAASLDVLAQISQTSRIERRETEDFVADLGRAVASDSGDFTRPTEGVVASSKPGTTTRPRPPVVTTIAVTKPKPPPKPSGGGGGEDFNP